MQFVNEAIWNRVGRAIRPQTAMGYHDGKKDAGQKPQNIGFPGAISPDQKTDPSSPSLLATLISADRVDMNGPRRQVAVSAGLEVDDFHNGRPEDWEAELVIIVQDRRACRLHRPHRSGGSEVAHQSEQTSLTKPNASKVFRQVSACKVVVPPNSPRESSAVK